MPTLAFETLGRQRIAALMVVAGPFFDTRREKLVALAVRHAVPTMHHFRQFIRRSIRCACPAHVERES
jgi:hypothetical protein